MSLTREEILERLRGIASEWWEEYKSGDANGSYWERAFDEVDRRTRPLYDLIHAIEADAPSPQGDTKP